MITTMSYNSKINNNGKYINFYGWTVISKLESDMKIIENFINKNNILRMYFSALPSSSYHITLYNLWCNGKTLLPQQQDVIDKEQCCDLKEQLEERSRSSGFFNPNNCLGKLFADINKNCKKHKWDKLKLVINKVLFNGHTIRITFKHNFDKMRKVRNSIIKLCDKHDNMKYFHMTLAYKYKNVPEKDVEKIKNEISILNMLLSDQTITLSPGCLHSFETMESFQAY